ncbi:MAG: hypothetical protein IPP07_25090 [Holophagales bacterium]|nr:hypothetical protein [Holophagales bacterium]
MKKFRVGSSGRTSTETGRTWRVENGVPAASGSQSSTAPVPARALPAPDQRIAR